MTRIEEMTELTASREPASPEGKGWSPIESCPRGRNVIMFGITAEEDGKVTNWRMDTGFIRYGDDDPWIVDKDGFLGVHWGGRWLRSYDHMPTDWHALPEPPKGIEQP